MNLAAFEGLLKQTMGLDAASIGSSAVERAVGSRASACNTENWQAYWELVSSTPSELQELIEAVVIPETWFFRDRDAFAAMARFAEASRVAGGRRQVRLLSVPCATGEEPYSMAIALLETGMRDSQFRVDAVDISAYALARAALAVYGKNSFRGDNLDFRDRYFTRETQGYRLSDAVRSHVDFEQGNVLDPRFKADDSYDIVFCRNLLIYFDAPTQNRAISVLTRLLRPDGYLFVGPSEASLLLNLGFRSAKIPLAFAFHKGTTSAAPKAAVDLVARPPTIARPISVRGRPTPGLSRPPAQVAPPRAMKPSLDEVQRLADQGHLAEAARHCEGYLRDHGASAEALFLLGIIRDAVGNQNDAAELYRKAIYLDPGHHLALAHLSLLSEKRGDAAGAKAVNDRIRRLNLRGSG